MTGDRQMASLALALLIGTTLAPAVHAADEPPSGTRDPIQTMNRAVFLVNDGVDRVVFEPLARGWEAITPEIVRHMLDHFFTNASFPLRFVGTLLQGRPVHAGEELGRFVVNTTVGIVGFFDPATRFGIGFYDEDMGQTLAVWRVSEGPYLVLPFFGSSTGRDAFGLAVDSAPGFLIPGRAFATPVEIVNGRALALDDVDLARKASLDFYAFARSAYRDTRRRLIRDRGEGAQESEDDLYELDDDLYELDE